MPKETLSYFSRIPAPPGALVSVPIRTKNVHALVTDCQQADSVKSAIKEAPYPIKKITMVHEQTFFTKEFLRAAELTSEYFATYRGAVIDQYIPHDILTNWRPKEGAAADNEPRKTVSESYVLALPKDERMSLYRSTIREEFAKKMSLLVIVPSRPLIESISKALTKGIEDYTVILHGELSKKEMLAAWERAVDPAHPLLIIATPSFLALPRRDFGIIIVEQENATGYKGMIRPFLDARIFARNLAKEYRTRLVYADTVLSSTRMAEKEAGEHLYFVPPKHRLVFPGTATLVDMTAYKDKKSQNLFSKELLGLIEEARDRSKSLFLFSVRKGLATLTVCGDCGTTVTCPNCKHPLVLHGTAAVSGEIVKGDKNTFRCHSCGGIFSAETRCTTCASWRLVPLGVGTERVATTVQELFPDIPVFVVDGDTVKTHKEGFDAVRRFKETPGAVFVGTERALLYLESVWSSAIVSLDSLFAIPDFKQNERIMRLAAGIREKTEHATIIQTRKVDSGIFAHVMRGTVMDFYREELAMRKKFGYPPYSCFIKISWQAEPGEEKEYEDFIDDFFSLYKPNIFSAFVPEAKGKKRMNALIRLESSAWPDTELIRGLQSLPRTKFSYDVYPEHLL